MLRRFRDLARAGRQALLLLGIVLTGLGPASIPGRCQVPAAPATPVVGIDLAPGEARNVAEHLSRAVEGSLGKIVQGLVAASRERRTLSLELRSLFRDRSHRVFVHLTGRIGVPPGKDPSPRIQKLFSRLEGFHLATNGSLGFDLGVPRLERREDGAVTGVAFDLSLVCIAPQVVEQVAGTAASLGTIGVSGYIANHILPFLDNMDALTLARGVSTVVDDVVVSSTSDLGQQGITHAVSTDPEFASRRASRFQRIFRDGFSVARLLRYLGEVLATSTQGVVLRYAGLALGGAVGQVLWPAGGAVVGAVLGALAIPLLGNVVITWLTKDLPLRYRIRRLVRLRRQLAETTDPDRAAELGETLVSLESAFLDQVQRGIETEDYAAFDRLAGALGRLDAEDRQVLDVFIRAIIDKLQFAILQDRNWNAARKYYQLLEKIERSAFTSDP